MVLFSHIEKIMKETPAKVALTYGEESFSYADIFDYVDRCEALLNKKTNVRMIVFSENPLHLIAWALCIAKCNGTMMPLNCQVTSEQILRAVESSDANAFFYDQKYAQKCSDLKLPFCVSDKELEAPPSYSQNRFVQNEPVPDFLITFSSGSTGAPKPIMIDQKTKLARAQQTIDLYGLTNKDIILCASPFFHSLGQRLTFVALCTGATLLYLDKFTPDLWIEAVHKNGVSFVIAVTSHLQALKNDLFKYSDQLKSLKTIVSSSAPISTDFKDNLFQKLGCDFHEIYGATEIAIATNLHPKDSKNKYATVGKPCDKIEIKIINDDLSICAPDEIGEIIVKSPLSFNGYYNQPEVNQESYVNGYFKTGDLGKIDSDGFLIYVSRKKDIIISGGINIYPKDIEDTLRNSDLLEDVSVIGVEDDLLGEVVVAICISEQADLCEKDLRKIANKKLASFQRPLKYFFVENFPIGPTGKISKKDLIEQYNPMNTEWTSALRLMMYGRDN